VQSIGEIGSVCDERRAAATIGTNNEGGVQSEDNGSDDARVLRPETGFQPRRIKR
jgi:hypothetical protein